MRRRTSPVKTPRWVCSNSARTSHCAAHSRRRCPSSQQRPNLVWSHESWSCSCQARAIFPSVLRQSTATCPIAGVAVPILWPAARSLPSRASAVSDSWALYRKIPLWDWVHRWRPLIADSIHHRHRRVDCNRPRAPMWRVPWSIVPHGKLSCRQRTPVRHPIW